MLLKSKIRLILCAARLCILCEAFIFSFAYFSRSLLGTYLLGTFKRYEQEIRAKDTSISCWFYIVKQGLFYAQLVSYAKPFSFPSLWFYFLKPTTNTFKIFYLNKPCCAYKNQQGTSGANLLSTFKR